MTCYAGTATITTPTILTATSTQVLAANPTRKFLLIQNNSAAHIGVGLNGETLTGIAPTSTNKCVNLPNGDAAKTLIFTDMFVPVGPITVYQTSGGTINTVVVVEG